MNVGPRIRIPSEHARLSGFTDGIPLCCFEGPDVREESREFRVLLVIRNCLCPGAEKTVRSTSGPWVDVP